MSKKTLKNSKGFLKEDKKTRNPAKSIRYQTIASAVMVIKAPKTAVNPK
jgi:hypothetical protein